MKNQILTIILRWFIKNSLRPKRLKPKGIFKEVDIKRHNEAIRILNGNKKKLKAKMIDLITSTPNYYNPAVLYALSFEVFRQNNKDEAMYWFYLAQLRARYDANLCMDNSAKQGVSVLNEKYGPKINKYAFQNLDKLEEIVTKVIHFVRNNKEDYDHRWLNLHGMWAVLKSRNEKIKTRELSKPKDKWEGIKAKTIDDYYNGFIEYVKPQKNNL